MQFVHLDTVEDIDENVPKTVHLVPVVGIQALVVVEMHLHMDHEYMVVHVV